MEPNKKYKIENEPNLLAALESDLADILADSVKAAKVIRGINDRAFDLTRKIIAIKKSNDTNTTSSKNPGQKEIDERARAGEFSGLHG
jgi:hypothetical protein